MKPNVKETVSRTVVVNNASDESRAYEIEAKVSIERDRVTSIHEGTVRPLGEEVDPMMAGMSLANFHSNAVSHQQIDFNTASDRQAIFEAVEDFISEIRTYAEEL